MILVKSHGLGNDYLVVHEASFPLTAGAARLLCDRHWGVGGDGVLEPVPSAVATAGLRIWNPDGSQAEKSGNGLRIYARYLVDHRGAPPELSIEVASGVVRCQVDPDGVTVEMGRATLEPAQIPTTERLRRSPVQVGEQTLHVCAVGMGNPHCVVWRDDDLDALPWRAWGRALEVDRRFPNRTNVQFARVRGPDALEARIWERGAGETAASGSSACAVAVSAVVLGLVSARDLRVQMSGGALRVQVSADLDVTLRGPVEETAQIRLASAWEKKLMVTG